MSKNQEALQDLKNRNEHFKRQGVFIGTNTMEVIQELVDKATTKKVVVNSQLKQWGYRCPSCNVSVEHDYCGRCGQALDWSEE